MKPQVGMRADFPLPNVRRGNRVLGGAGAAPPQTGSNLQLTISSEEIVTIAASSKAAAALDTVCRARVAEAIHGVHPSAVQGRPFVATQLGARHAGKELRAALGGI